jgi:hypothetical protein
MKSAKILIVFCLLFTVSKKSFSQSYPFFEMYIPISANEKDALANGYYNPFTNNFILEQENKKVITRLLYDSLFNLKQKYTVAADSISFAYKTKKSVFLKEFCSSIGSFEIYANNNRLQLWQLDFEAGSDKKIAEFQLRQQYKDETVIAIIPGNGFFSFVSFSEKADRILLYDYFFGKGFYMPKEYTLPQKSLTKEEIKERGKFLAVKYSNSLYGLYASDLKVPKPYEINTGNQLFYDDNTIYFLLRTPYNAGFHLLELDRNSSNLSFKNFLINKLNPEKFSTPLEKIPVATAIDSLLIIQTSNVNTFAYHFYNLKTKEQLAFHETGADNSLYKLVNSELSQIGTYASKDEEKDITNEKLFLRRKNKGSLFLKAAKSDNDSLLLTFGSYTPTEGIGGTLLSFATMGISDMMAFGAGIVQMLPYLTLSRNKFLFAYSKFSLKSLQPSTATGITTPINKFAGDKRIDDLEKNSSFIIEKGNKLYIGIFNKKINKYNILVY